MNKTAYREAQTPNPEPSEANNAARAVADERQRVRDALHDGLGQLLTSISFLAGSLNARLGRLQLPEEAEQAQDILTLTRQAIDETQALVVDLEAVQKRL